MDKSFAQFWNHTESVLILGISKTGGNPPPLYKMCVCVCVCVCVGGGGGGGGGAKNSGGRLYDKV